MPDTTSVPAASSGGLAPSEVFHVDSPVVACDGGDGALGHPRVWLRIVHHQTMCPYCSRLYILNEGAGHGDGH